ncbi:ExeM/NucH family extracellular endonuclease [Actinotalea ferrariae]|uniref:ExeM/NucH family extracellular endonuclease n=1 Tax=Actinotalea ferrariae TaxID=1386098 RepID=UPI001C8C7237|nr:ExeM/NucH family extracellular endonuclease [Actinotalea ferrariae]MBX9243909.1 ExeM/NucH family extracellular endonuclease [Actinotalea ferrariae]
MHPLRRGTPRLLALSAAGATALATGIVAPAAADDVVAAAATHTIAEVQGDADATPVAGATVTVEGVVTADHREGGYRGIYIQTPGSGGAQDATPGASDGVFVFLGSRTTPAVVGDLVSVTGVAAEYFGLTQINASAAAATVEVLGAGELPAAVALPDTVVGADREAYEGMLVNPQGSYLVASTHEVDRFGTVWLAAGDALPVKSTELARPGPEADAIAAANDARLLLLDDGRNNQVTGATQPYLTADPVRTGDAAEFGELAYVLHYGFDRWRLQPTTPLSATTSDALEPTFTELNPRPAAPAEVGGDLTVAAFNVLNYFTTLTSEDSTARGAATAEAFAIQKAKIVAAISALDADVVALQEIENSVHFGDGTPDVALADLVAGLNEAAGAEEWAYVATPAALVGEGAPDTDVIMNAIIYRTASVTPLGDAATQVDEEVWDIAREPIAQAFTTPAGEGSAFLVVANHFKSKGGDGEEPADGQGQFNAERVEQAEAVLALTSELQAQTGIDDAVVLGDLNAYAQEDPVVVFTSQGWVDLVPARDPGASTYTFDGELGSLDHALASPSFAARVTGADVWDINADEWSGHQYAGPFADPSHVYRASDHDPILVGVQAEGDVAGTVEIDLLGINDFHGRLEPDGATAGAAVLAGAVDAFRAENADTLFVSAGDNIGASTFTSFVAEDEPTLDALDAMGLDVSAIGNHELDRGRPDLENRVVPQIDFPYLAANLYDTTTGEPAFDESWVTEVDGVRVGFIGAVTAELPSLVSPTGIATIDTRAVVPEVNRVAAALSDGDEANGEAEVLVLLVHEGPATGAVEDSTDDSVFGQIVAGVDAEIDAIFAGHTHQAHAHQLPVAGWPEGLTRPVVQSGQYGQNLAHVTLEVDPATGDVVASSSALVPLAPGGVPAFPADAEVAQIVADAVAAADELGKASLGEITDDLLRARQSDGTDNRGGESTLGNLVADVQLWATQDVGTEIAFMNPGGLRADLTYASSNPDDPDGNVTYREAATVQSFANTLVTMTLTGEQVVEVLEQQWQPAAASRPFLKLGVAGLTYTYDPTAAAGERITDVRVGDAPLDLTAPYRVVANSFLAGGGDNFTTLAEGTQRADSGRVDLQAFVDYLAAFTPVSPDLAQRAVGVDLGDVPAEGYVPGDTVTVALSSLLFSAGEPQEGAQVVLSVGGQQVATAPIDPTIVDTTDEVGRATVSFTVPQGVTGTELEVTGTVDVTGTEFTFTVPLGEVSVPETCRVDHIAQPLGIGIFLSVVQVTNLSDERLRGWELTWDYTNGERTLLGIGARVDQRGSTVTATSRDVLRPGRSASFLLLGFGRPGTPAGFELDGMPCSTS